MDKLDKWLGDTIVFSGVPKKNQKGILKKIKEDLLTKELKQLDKEADEDAEKSEARENEK